MPPNYNNRLTRGTRTAFVARSVRSTRARSNFAAMQAQVIIGNLVEPKLFEESFKLSPVVVLLSLGIWGSLWVRYSKDSGTPPPVYILPYYRYVKFTVNGSL